MIAQNIDNQELKNDLEYVRQVTGICPQHDILFDTISVEEHLDIFCDFKGVPHDEKEAKIEKIMRDVGVYQHRSTMAKDLSGGNRRKLSVALALVADSKLVLLDEPTSGMDLNARRRLWDMLKDYKKDRIIILTTHNMDEADLLGDRIGIMSHGRLVCLGNSMFLKNQYGCGYKLQIKKAISPDMLSSSSHLHIEAYLQRHFPHDSLTLLSDDPYTCCFQIAKHQSHKFPQFFDLFDSSLTNLSIKSYTVSVSSLEEVFLKVCEEQEIEVA